MMRATAGLALALLLSGCLVVTEGGPEEDRPERREFVPAPVTDQEFRAAIADSVGPPFEAIEGSFRGLGQYPGPQGPLTFGEFDAVDAETGDVLTCTGYAAPFQSMVGCGSPDLQDGDTVRGAIDVTSTGTQGTWSEAEFRVSDEVAELAVVADDGTTYRVVPIGGFAWMEWRAERGDLVVSALDESNEVLEAIEVDVGPE